MSSCEGQYYNHPSHNLAAAKPLAGQIAVEDQGHNQPATLPSEKSVGANGHAEMILSASGSGDDASYLRTVLAGSPGHMVEGSNLTESYSGTWFNSFGYQVYSGWGASTSYGVAGTPHGYMTVSLNPAHPADVGAGPTANFTAVLHTAFPGEVVTQSATALTANALTVNAYYVQGAVSHVGAVFNVVYNPGAGDPSGNSVHWIQVVTDNDKPGQGGGFGVNENIVDNLGAGNPYYDTIGAANSTGFYDNPWRSNGQYAGISWNAEVWLVKETAPNTVTTYGGISWGWLTQAP
jgi:hypothetical protein